MTAGNNGLAWIRRGVFAAVLLVFLGVRAAFGQAGPSISSVARGENGLILSVTVPGGFRHAVLESGSTVHAPDEPLIAGGMDGGEAILTFRVPPPEGMQFFRVRVGESEIIPPAPYSGPSYFSVEYTGGPLALTEEEKIGHVLTRLAYGPEPGDIETIQALGVSAYIERQLNPEMIEEPPLLAAREAELFRVHQPGEDQAWVKPGDTWRYMKGAQAPPAGWAGLAFDDGGWLEGPSGIGYGDEDDATVLEDMRETDTNPGYVTVYMRKRFSVSSPEDFDAVVFTADFDDGFVAYLNGNEIARVNVEGVPPPHTEEASSDHEAGSPVEFEISLGMLLPGENVLAIELHNVNATSSDATMIPSLAGRKYLPVPPEQRIRSISALQDLVHVRGIYSKRQLQAVLGEFWENHFTTDYDKVEDYFEDLRDSDARRAMGEEQAEEEAAQAEYLEYEFFYENALGNFGDLLLYSATSPPQLIYLDSVLNVKGAANENYAREILELFAFGVDNRYTQRDIEELARCFTGWSVRKVRPGEKLAFPDSARTPPTEPNIRFNDTVLLDAGPGWKYFKGTAEPAPGPGGVATTAWAEAAFDDSGWLNGASGFGFGDGDDATEVNDMRRNYLTLYLRREFMVADISALENLVLEMDYDDSFIAYLNGTEIARSRTLEGAGNPPAFDRTANGNHEAGRPEAFSLGPYLDLLKPAPEVNVLAIQGHNVSLSSSDFTLIPRLVIRELAPGSIENGDPNGIWTFRFDPEEHDYGAKVLFEGTPHEIRVPEGRSGIEGLLDGVEIIDGFVNHPSVSEFICLKLINKFVSDEITLDSYKDGTAPPELMELMESAIQAWNSTAPAGNIEMVMRAILTPATQEGHFWSRAAHRAKIKTPVEFINSSVRALGAEVSGTTLPEVSEALGMHLFTRDDPDGWSELGGDWIDTGTMLNRIKFAQALAGDRLDDVEWDMDAWLAANGLSSAESIIDYFNELLFQGSMAASNRELLIEFATTDVAGNPLPLNPDRSDYARRARELVGLILSMPQWHYQ